jgi:hypothetical protein
LDELLLVRGISREMFFGEDTNRNGRLDAGEDLDQDGELRVGLRDFLTVHGDGRLNLNTVSAAVLGAVPGFSPGKAAELVAYRRGGDGQDGTADDVVFASLSDLEEVPWLTEFEYLRLAAVGKVSSQHFTVEVLAREPGTRQRAHVSATIERGSDGVATLTWRER